MTKQYGPITSNSPFFNKERHERNLKEIEEKHTFYVPRLGGPFITRDGYALFLDEPLRSRVEEIMETEGIPVFFKVKR